MSDLPATSATKVPAHIAAMRKRDDIPTGKLKNDSNPKIPRAKIMQGLSEEVTSGICKLGELYLEGTGQILKPMTEPVVIVPIYITENWVEFDEGECLGRANTLKEAKKLWPDGPDKKGEVGDLTWQHHQYNILAFINDCELPHIISFSGSNTPAGRSIKDKANFLDAVYMRGYSMKVEARKDGKRKWFTFENPQPATDYPGLLEGGWITADKLEVAIKIAQVMEKAEGLDLSEDKSEDE